MDRARQKAYWRLLPLLFLSYVIAYVDRANVSLAKLTMLKDLGFDNAVIGTATGVFFWAIFFLEIPCALAIEKWSARRLICRIMVIVGHHRRAHRRGENADAVLLRRALCSGWPRPDFFPAC